MHILKDNETTVGREVLYRLALFSTLFLFAVWLPWWVALVCALFFMLVKGFYETIVIGILLDGIYINQGDFFLAGDFIFTATLLLAAGVFFTLAQRIHPQSNGII